MSSASIKLATFSLKLGALTNTLSSLSTESRDLHEQNRTALRPPLYYTLRTIHTLWTTLEALPPTHSSSEKDDDLERDSDDSDEEEESSESNAALVVLQKNVEELERNVNILASRTKRGLVAIQDLKVNSADVYTQIQSLNGKISEAKVELELELKNKREQHSSATRVYNQRVAEHSRASNRLSELEEKLQDKKDDRTMLRVGRAAMWGTSLFLPGMVVVAAGMELAAKKIRDDIAYTKDEKRTCEEELNNARNAKNTINSQVSALSSKVSTAMALVSLCKLQFSVSSIVMSNAMNLWTQATATDQAVAKLKGITGEMENHMEMIDMVRGYRRELQNAVMGLIREVSKGDGRDLMLEFKPLMLSLEGQKMDQ